MAFRCNLAVPAVPAAICDETSWGQTQVVQEHQTQVVQSQRQPSNLVQVSCDILKEIIICPFPPASTIPLVKKWEHLDCEVFNDATPQGFANFMADVFEELLKQGVVNPLFVAKVVKVLALFMGVFKKISCKMSRDKLLDLLRTDEKVLPDPNLASQAYAALIRRKYRHLLHEEFGIAVTYAYLVIYYEVYVRKNLYPVVSQPDFGNTKVVVQKMEEAERRYFKYYVLILWRMFPELPRENKRRVIQTVLKHCGFSFIENHETIVTTDIQKAIKNKEVKVAEEQKKKEIKKYDGRLKTLFKNGGITKLKCAVFQCLDAQNGGMNCHKSGKKDRRYNLSDIAKWFHYVWWKNSSSLELPDIIWINDATRPQLVRWFRLNWGKILWTKMLNAVCNKMLQSS